MALHFVKMEGAGNDYVYVDAVHQPFPVERAAELARRWSDRHYGIGADGLILLLASDRADFAMRMWNADGSEGAMCGNGLRCAAALALQLGIARRRAMAVATAAGVRAVEVVLAGNVPVAALADLGQVRLLGPERVRAAGRDLELVRGDAGNPHAVLFLDGDPAAFPVLEVGAELQVHPAFPGGVNVEFAQALPDGSLRQRTYERGSGETLACGTGAAVAALAALAGGRVPGPSVAVHLRGGVLTVHRRDLSLVLEGPVRTVYRGEIDLPAP